MSPIRRRCETPARVSGKRPQSQIMSPLQIKKGRVECVTYSWERRARQDWRVSGEVYRGSNQSRSMLRVAAATCRQSKTDTVFKEREKFCALLQATAAAADVVVVVVVVECKDAESKSRELFKRPRLASAALGHGPRAQRTEALNFDATTNCNSRHEHPPTNLFPTGTARTLHTHTHLHRLTLNCSTYRRNG